MDPRYPIGRHEAPESYDQTVLHDKVAEIKQFPEDFAKLAMELSKADELERTYRPGGWSARQVIAHVADSHMNAMWRFKAALTQQRPSLPGYDQEAWANLPDATSLPVEPIVSFIETLHMRWVALMEGMDEVQWHRNFWHIEYEKEYILWKTAHLYAWHGRHHAGHLQAILNAE